MGSEHGVAPWRASARILEPEMEMKSSILDSSGIFITLSVTSYMTLTKESIFMSPIPGEFCRT